MLTETIEYDPIIRVPIDKPANNENGVPNQVFVIIMPTRYYTKAVSFLERNVVSGEEMRVRPITDLPPEEQARLRGFTVRQASSDHQS